MRNPGLEHNMGQFFVPRLILRYRVRRILSKASKCLINGERKKLGVSGTVASIKMKGMYNWSVFNWSVFNCTRMQRAKFMVQLEFRISGV